jgi:hypothetical protein
MLDVRFFCSRSITTSALLGWSLTYMANHPSLVVLDTMAVGCRRNAIRSPSSDPLGQ